MAMDYKDFDTRDYLVTRYPSTMFEEDEGKFMVPWDIECYHSFYKIFREEWDNTKAVLLQLGAGPCIYDLISAAPYVAEIYHSDYLKCCCDEVLLWRNNDPNAYDWLPYFRHVVNTLEGKHSPHAVVEREELLRSIIKDSFTCDVKQSPMVLPGLSKTPDIICTNFCLEFAIPSNERYTGVLKEVFTMLKPNGFLVMLSNLECTWYAVGGTKFLCVCLTKQDIENALREVGFVVHFKDTREKPLLARNINNDSTGHGFFVAQKS